MKENITLIMYSHSSYSDVWPLFFNQAREYLPDYTKVLFCDDDRGLVPDDWTFIIYDDKLSYSDRVSTCLESIKTPLSFFHHEDMFLYDNPDIKLLKKYEEIVLNDNIDFIRLLRSTDSPGFCYKGLQTLYQVPNYSQYFFSVQPSICKTDSLKGIYSNTKVNHIREFETKVQDTCRMLNIKALFHYNNEPKRGMHHYDSKIYPYIATAVVKGKWNLTDYPQELIKILNKNNINVDKRGKI